MPYKQGICFLKRDERESHGVKAMDFTCFSPSVNCCLEGKKPSIRSSKPLHFNSNTAILQQRMKATKLTFPE